MLNVWEIMPGPEATTFDLAVSDRPMSSKLRRWLKREDYDLTFVRRAPRHFLPGNPETRREFCNILGRDMPEAKTVRTRQLLANFLATRGGVYEGPWSGVPVGRTSVGTLAKRGIVSKETVVCPCCGKPSGVRITLLNALTG
jgi:hypothetical protein